MTRTFPLTSFPLQLPPALLVDEAGGHRAEQDGGCQETDGGHDAGHHRPRQSTLLHQLRRREEVCGGEEGRVRDGESRRSSKMKRKDVCRHSRGHPEVEETTH